MYYRDHEPPHFHAVYGEYQAQIVITTLDPLFGECHRGHSGSCASGPDWTAPCGAASKLGESPRTGGPMFEPLRANADLFRQMDVDEELGTIVWPNGADMNPDVLHGDLEPAEQPINGRVFRVEP